MPIFKICLKIEHSKASFVALSPSIGHFIVESLDLDGPAKISLDNPSCQPESQLHGVSSYYFEMEQANEAELDASLQALIARLLAEVFDPEQGPAVSYERLAVGI